MGLADWWTADTRDTRAFSAIGATGTYTFVTNDLPVGEAALRAAGAGAASAATVDCTFPSADGTFTFRGLFRTASDLSDVLRLIPSAGNGIIVEMDALGRTFSIEEDAVGGLGVITVSDDVDMAGWWFIEVRVNGTSVRLRVQPFNRTDIMREVTGSTSLSQTYSGARWQSTELGSIDVMQCIFADDATTDIGPHLAVALLPPNGDVATGWTLTGAPTHWEALDERPFSQADYIEANTNVTDRLDLTNAPVQAAATVASPVLAAYISLACFSTLTNQSTITIALTTSSNTNEASTTTGAINSGSVQYLRRNAVLTAARTKATADGWRLAVTYNTSVSNQPIEIYGAYIVAVVDASANHARTAAATETFNPGPQAKYTLSRSASASEALSNKNRFTQSRSMALSEALTAIVAKFTAARSAALSESVESVGVTFSLTDEVTASEVFTGATVEFTLAGEASIAEALSIANTFKHSRSLALSETLGDGIVVRFTLAREATVTEVLASVKAALHALEQSIGVTEEFKQAVTKFVISRTGTVTESVQTLIFFPSTGSPTALVITLGVEVEADVPEIEVLADTPELEVLVDVPDVEAEVDNGEVEVETDIPETDVTTHG